MLVMDDKSDSFDPQFLTFRHNTPQALPSSGRSIYSQRFDYKSLQKSPIFDACNSMREDPNARTAKKTKHNIREKHLRTVRSQQKYKEVIFGQAYNAEDQDDHIVVTQSLEFQRKPSGRLQDKTSMQQSLEKNIELKSKLSKLVKSMKKEQRRDYTLGESIHELETELEGYDREIEEQANSMAELKQISSENMKECNRIIELMNRVSSRSQRIAAQLENLEESVDSIDTVMGTGRQDEAKDRLMCSKLKQGLGELTRMKSAAEAKVNRLQQQIQALEYHLEQLKLQEGEIGKILGWIQPNSLRTSFHHSNSHSQNQSNSSGSNRQSLYYY